MKIYRAYYKPTDYTYGWFENPREAQNYLNGTFSYLSEEDKTKNYVVQGYEATEIE